MLTKCDKCGTEIKEVTNDNKDLYGTTYFCSDKCKIAIEEERANNRAEWRNIKMKCQTCNMELEEDIDVYLINGRPARYMIEAFSTTEHGEDIIAGTHPFDRTARPQTVNDWNPGWRKIIEKFKEKTGVGGILNTSFNLHGFPIVGSPEVALDTFENSALDGLAIGDWLIIR